MMALRLSSHCCNQILKFIQSKLMVRLIVGDIWGRSITSSRRLADLARILVCSSLEKCWYLRYIIARLLRSVYCFDLSITITGEMNPRLPIMASDNRCRNTREVTTLCTVQTNNISKAAEKWLSTPF